MNEETVAWRLRFLAAVAGYLHKANPNEQECCGLMWILYDIADMIDPPATKDGDA